MNRRVQAVSAIALGLDLALSFRYERYQPLALLLAAIVLAVFLHPSGWWRTRRALSVALALDVALIFLYLWTLDERMHVTIHATASGYLATIDGLDLPLTRPVLPGRIGFSAGAAADYGIQPTGQAVTAAPTSLLARFHSYIRFAAPRSAWANARVTSRSQGVVDLSASRRADTPAGAWSTNRRGELEGDLGSYTLFEKSMPRDFTFEADLMRADGPQGILLGVDAAGNGYTLVPQLDQSNVLWAAWSNGQRGAVIASTSLNPQTLAMLQRTLRLFLANVIVALLLILVCALAYQVFAAGNRLLAGPNEDPSAWRSSIDPRLANGVVAAAAVAAVVAAALVADKQLQRIPHVQDSMAYLFQARTLALGRLFVPAPRPASFFGAEFILIDHGRWFSKYTPGWPVLLAVGVLFRNPWLVNPVLAGADLVLLYLTGREAYGRPVALIATLLALSSPFFLFLAASMMAHTAALFYLLGFAYLSARWARRLEREEPSDRDAWRLLCPAGFLLGMAALTREVDALTFAVPFLFLVPPRLLLKHLRALGWLVLGVAGPLLFLLYYNWQLTGDPTRLPYLLYWPFDHLGFGSTAFGDFTPGHGLWNTSMNLGFLLAHLFGWPFYFTLALAAIPFLLGRANRVDYVFGASALLLMATYTLYWNPGVMYGPRYYYVAIPWFALLTARGLEELYRLPLRLPLGATRDRIAALSFPTLLIALLAVCDLSVYLPAQVPIYRGYNFASAEPLDAVQRAGIHHALVFVAHPDMTWASYGVPFSANSPLLDGDIIYARDQGRLDAQLARLYPGRRTYRLDGVTVHPFRP